MAVLPIVEWPSKVLETKAKEVTEFNEELQKLARDMHETMEHEKGIGLAANQVDRLHRILVIHIPHVEASEDSEEYEEKSWWHDKKFTLVNPEIVGRQGKVKCIEGCLSFPEVYEYVDRADTVKIKAKDEFGKDQEFEADGLFSVCLQHEIDHIDGIVFINRMSRMKAAAVRKKYLKRSKQREAQA